MLPPLTFLLPLLLRGVTGKTLLALLAVMPPRKLLLLLTDGVNSEGSLGGSGSDGSDSGRSSGSKSGGAALQLVEFTFQRPHSHTVVGDGFCLFHFQKLALNAHMHTYTPPLRTRSADAVPAFALVMMCHYVHAVDLVAMDSFVILEKGVFVLNKISMIGVYVRNET